MYVLFDQLTIHISQCAGIAWSDRTAGVAPIRPAAAAPGAQASLRVDYVRLSSTPVVGAAVRRDVGEVDYQAGIRLPAQIHGLLRYSFVEGSGTTKKTKFTAHAPFATIPNRLAAPMFRFRTFGGSMHCNLSI